MRMAVLQAGCAPQSLIPEHGDYDLMSKRLLGLTAAQTPTFRALDGVLPRSPQDFDVYIVTGSPSGVYEDYLWIKRLETFLKQAFAQNRKIIGLCFGHQILAKALGGRVVKSGKGYGIGVMDYALNPASTDPERLSLCAWHQDQVVQAPESAKVILSSGFCPLAGLQYGNQAISFQPHPEFTKAFLGDLITVREGDTISKSVAKTARETLVKETDTPRIKRLLTAFLEG